MRVVVEKVFERYNRRELLEGVGRVFLLIAAKVGEVLGMAGIEIRGVSKVFGPAAVVRDGRTIALDGVNLEVADGQLLALVGPSGSGKTTLLRLIAGLDSPTVGSLRLGGRDLNGVPPRQRDVAMVFQHVGLYGHLSARRTLSLGLELRESGGWFSSLGRRFTMVGASPQIDQLVDETARLLGIETLLDRHVGELSGGERQRVALGRAIVRRPAAWLMDEPLASLDAPARLAMRQELKQLQRKLRITTIYVTHDQAEALALADRIAVLHEGRLQQVGTPQEIYDAPQNLFVAGFFGSHGINLLPGRLTATDGGIQFEHSGFHFVIAENAQPPLRPHVGQAVVAGIRPEDVKLSEANHPTADGCPATVEFVDDLGEASVIHLKLTHPTANGQRLISRCDRNSKLNTGASLQVKFDQTHWFNPSTGASLTNY